MKNAHLAALALVLGAAGCGGGGGVVSTGPSVPAPPSVPASTSLSISIPLKGTSTIARAASYVSDGTMALAIYDGATLLYVGNLFLTPGPAFTTLYAKSGTTTVTPGDCVKGPLRATCTFTVNTTAGPHTFGLTAYGNLQGGVVLPGSAGRQVLDTGTPPTFTGLILSEGELSMTAVGGTNPAQTMTLLGVADIVQWFGTQPPVGFNQSGSLNYAIQDARSGQIVQPGDAYDNGPVTITASPAPLVSMTPVSQSVPPTTNGSQSFTFKCVSGSGGRVTFTATGGTHPTATYASGLTYSASNYSNGTLGSTSVQCNGS